VGLDRGPGADRHGDDRRARTLSSGKVGRPAVKGQAVWNDARVRAGSQNARIEVTLPASSTT
jgi:hypothetical protein